MAFPGRSFSDSDSAMNSARTSSLLGLVLLAASVLSCGPPRLPEGPKAPTPPRPPSDYQCKVVRGADNPWLVEWDPADKVRLQSEASRGVLLVKYEGCSLEVLYGCSVDGKYDFTATTRAHSVEYINNEAELFAKLPIGALKLAGEFRQGDRWSLDYVLVGTRDAAVGQVSRSGLSGRCAEATHFVQGMVVGAYRMGSAADRAGGAEVGLGGAGAGGNASSSVGIIRQEGSHERCVDDSTPAEDPACQAIVQLSLQPVTGIERRPPAVRQEPIVDAVSEPWAPEAGVPEAVVEFRSDPAGAVVLVDGELLCQKTPCSRSLRHRRYRFSMQADDYLPREEELHITGNRSIDWKLDPDFGWITVLSDPPGLEVKIDGRSAGRTPLLRERTLPGRRSVRTFSRCHLDAVEHVEVKRGEQRSISLEPSPLVGAIRVFAEDEEGNALAGDVFVDGAVVGTVPGTFTVPVCAREIRVETPSGSWEGSLSVVEREVLPVKAVVTAKPALPPRFVDGASVDGQTEGAGEATAKPGRLNDVSSLGVSLLTGIALVSGGRDGDDRVPSRVGSSTHLGLRLGSWFALNLGGALAYETTIGDAPSASALLAGMDLGLEWRLLDISKGVVPMFGLGIESLWFVQGGINLGDRALEIAFYATGCLGLDWFVLGKAALSLRLVGLVGAAGTGENEFINDDPFDGGGLLLVGTTI